MMPSMNLFTVWMLRLDGVNPKTGTSYMLGWGELVLPEELNAFAHEFDPDDGTPTVGGAGWYSKPRVWGGFGMQYKREPYVSLSGELGMEDRVSAEVYVPGALNLVARAFGARTKRLVADAFVQDFTTGLELVASYERWGVTSNLGLEIGRTFYTALDDTIPMTTGFVASAALTIQHAGTHAWRR
jgi:hypothetical protein